MRRILLPVVWSIALALGGAPASAASPSQATVTVAVVHPSAPLPPIHRDAIVLSKEPAQGIRPLPIATAAPKSGWALPAKVVAAVESPIARKLAVSAISPVPKATFRIIGQRIVGARGAAEKIESIADTELAKMAATDLAGLAAPVIRPNIFQRATFQQKERLANAFFRVLDAAASDSPGKFDAVTANLRITPHVIPGRFKLAQMGAKAAFQQRVEENRIPRGDLRAFDERLGDMGMQQGDGSLRVLVDGPAAFGDLHQTMMTALDSAKTTGKPGFVLLSTFALHSDETGHEVAADLKALSAAGFKVHVLYDGFGSKMTDGAWSDPKFYEDMKAAGVNLTMKSGGSAFFMHNSHKKPIEVGYYAPDGPKLVEYNGDMNIGDPYKIDWHGSMSRIEGPATKATLGALVEQLKSNGAPITPAEEATFRQVADAQVSKPGMSPIWTVNHRGPVDLYNKMTILSMVDVAPKGGHVFVEQPYVDDPDLFAALERAAKEGVNVHMIVPLHNDEKLVALATRLEYKKLMDAGVHVYKYNGPEFKNPDGFSHLKRIVVLDEKGEGVISEDGSSNGDAQSFYHNDELIHVLTTSSIADPTLRQDKSMAIKQIARDVFVKDIKESTPVTAADVPKPGLSSSLDSLLTNWHVSGWML